ncbi:MAG: sigma-54-dependent Fis family transcriptional regulator [Acidobacteria bacterium]|nr:sigma-54-dependent Fis family transcriptional regulator [Acidobacteriota bacterium]
MQVSFVPGILMEKWQLPAHVTPVCAADLTAENIKTADILVISAEQIAEISPENWPVPKPVIDAVDSRPQAKQVREWMLNGAQNIILEPAERTASFIGIPLSPIDDMGAHGLIGSSPEMVKLGQMIEKVAVTSATVLIRGESGTGKELVARAIHSMSSRQSRSFVPVNCAAIPETLLEDELFGHVKGAFTDAQSDRKGKLEEAEGGTIFLDEIGDMPPLLQVKLLRMLQEREIQPLGSNQPKKVDVRIIAATAANLEQMIKEKKFREDLFFRLNVIPIFIPPLRERKEDIPRLIHHFSEALSVKHGVRKLRFTDAAMDVLTSLPWKGNVRELEHFVERTLVLFDHTRPVDAADLPFPTVERKRT